MEIKHKFLILILILIFLASFWFFSNNEDDQEILNYYSYIGPTGDVFHFNITQVNGVDRHLLEYTFTRDGIDRLSIVPFRYSPMDLEEIYIEDVRSLIINSEVIYISRDYNLGSITDAKDAVAILTLARIIDDEMDPDIYQIPTGVAITYAVEGIFSPVVGCDYANLEARVVELRLGTENKIYQEGAYCVVMEFKEGDDPIKIATKLTYHVLNIM